MLKKVSFLIFLSLVILSLAACVSTATPSSPGGAPTSPPATQAPPASSTPLPPPTETPTSVPPTATTVPANALQHYASGQKFTITYLDMVDTKTGWGIGSLGAQVGDHVLTTSDGGTTWRDVTPPETQPLSDTLKAAVGFFQDARTAWVTYFNGPGYPVISSPVVWRTSDGGATWAASQPLDVTGLSEIYVPSALQFVAGQDGWMLAHVGVGMNHDYVVLYRSTDGGITWSRIIDPYGDSGIQSCTKSAMLFTDATHGWLTGDCHGVKAGVLLYSSTDAGSTWQEAVLPGPSGSPNLFSDMNNACGSYNPFFFGNDLGRLSVTCTNYSTQQAVNSYYIYSTQDGGKSWTGATYPGTALYFFSADSGWALSNKIQQTSDGGKTWKPIADVTWSAQMDFISQQIGWAVATANNQVALVYSDNGGARWSVLSPTVGP